ncbi:MAG: hypothetical protein AAF961_15115 [Planctomycetota bacterium]
MAPSLLEFDPMISLAGRSFALLLLTLGAAVVCRRGSAALVHGIWAAGLAGCLAIPAAALLPVDWKLPVLPSTSAGAASPRHDKSATYATETLPSRPAT